MIIAFGNPVYDYIKTPAITTGKRVLSGCSTNGCLALARLGHKQHCCCIGTDYYDRFMSEVQHYNITPYVQLCDQTGGFRLIYNTWADRTLDVLGLAAPIKHVPAACADAQAIIIGPILQETPEALIAQIRATSAAPLFLDPQAIAAGRRRWPDRTLLPA